MSTNHGKPEPDPYRGRGGRYVRDPATGRRRPVDDSTPLQPQPATLPQKTARRR